MADTLMNAFKTFPDEAAIIGRLLAGYGELELMLCLCAASARQDFNMVFKAMFRPRGESQRIDIGDALGRDLFRIHKLETQFSEAVSDMRYCLKIRNQYAHCYWSDGFGRQLGFVEMEERAKSAKPIDAIWQVPSMDIDVPTLNEQEAFFFRTGRCFSFLTNEIDVREGRLSTNPFLIPPKVKRPPLHMP